VSRRAVGDQAELLEDESPEGESDAGLDALSLSADRYTDCCFLLSFSCLGHEATVPGRHLPLQRWLVAIVALLFVEPAGYRAIGAARASNTACRGGEDDRGVVADRAREGDVRPLPVAPGCHQLGAVPREGFRRPESIEVVRHQKLPGSRTPYSRRHERAASGSDTVPAREVSCDQPLADGDFVADLQRAVEFYVERLGFAVMEEYRDDVNYLTWVAPKGRSTPPEPH
jgi:hypothetical protein